jgi:predicted HD phosphohydrolase
MKYTLLIVSFIALPFFKLHAACESKQHDNNFYREPSQLYIEVPFDKFHNTACEKVIIQAFADPKNNNRLLVVSPKYFRKKHPSVFKNCYIACEDLPTHDRQLSFREYRSLIMAAQAAQSKKGI